ncbi:MAG: hypothetical protein WEB85_10725 [Dongiaceae bacterium]
MKLHSVLQGEASRFVKIVPTRGIPYIPHALLFIRDRYGFMEAPESLDEFDTTKGITFSHGKFRPSEAETTSEVVIEKLRIYEQGLLAQTRASVEDAELFLDDFLAWSCRQFELKLLDYPPIRRLYHSSIEFQSDIEFESLLEPIRSIGKTVSECLASYGIGAAEFVPTGFSLHCDMLSQPMPSIFTFERRAGHPHSAGLFLSSAPLKTADHIKLIKDFESSLRKR